MFCYVEIDLYTNINTHFAAEWRKRLQWSGGIDDFHMVDLHVFAEQITNPFEKVVSAIAGSMKEENGCCVRSTVLLNGLA